MIRFHIILFTIVLIYVTETLSAPYKNDIVFGIVGGFIAKEGEFPYQVSLRSRRSMEEHFCGGSILNERYVITAAHCGEVIKNHRLKDFYIGAGVTNKNDKRHMISKEIESVHIHEKYNSTSLENDICIIKIKGEYTYSRTVQPLDINPEHIEEGTNCTISGWGKWNELAWRVPNELKGAYVFISNQTQCVANYSSTQPVYLDSMVCAGVPGGGTDSCSGDSGGPMVCHEKLTGIVSWGIGCAQPDYPGVYARVEHYVDWINNNSAVSNAQVKHFGNM